MEGIESVVEALVSSWQVREYSKSGSSRACKQVILETIEKGKPTAVAAYLGLGCHRPTGNVTRVILVQVRENGMNQRCLYVPCLAWPVLVQQHGPPAIAVDGAKTY
jgi:hypothetical protein